MRDFSRRAAALVLATSIAAAAEGLRQYAYYDPVGILTVCYGHTQDVDPNRKYSLQECRALLTQEMNEALDVVESCVPGLGEYQLAAFADAVYNIGPKVVCNLKESKLARLLAEGKIIDACLELTNWNKARVAGVLVELPGLSKRRRVERTYCLDIIG